MGGCIANQGVVIKKTDVEFEESNPTSILKYTLALSYLRGQPVAKG